VVITSQIAKLDDSGTRHQLAIRAAHCIQELLPCLLKEVHLRRLQVQIPHYSDAPLIQCPVCGGAPPSELSTFHSKVVPRQADILEFATCTCLSVNPCTPSDKLSPVPFPWASWSAIFEYTASPLFCMLRLPNPARNKTDAKQSLQCLETFPVISLLLRK
jgi:hypothetical protein